MRGKIYKLFEYGYIAMALFSIYLVLTNWNENRERSYMFIIFAVVAVGMYFFKRWFRKNMENRSK
jgi:FtsH-binding integral membrane protein